MKNYFELNLFVSEIFRKATCLQLKYNEIMESKQDLNHKCYVFSITRVLWNEDACKFKLKGKRVRGMMHVYHKRSWRLPCNSFTCVNHANSQIVFFLIFVNFCKTKTLFSIISYLKNMRKNNAMNLKNEIPEHYIRNHSNDHMVILVCFLSTWFHK